MRPHWSTSSATALVAGTAILFLAACSALPIPHEVDLRAQLSETSGTVTAEVKVGAVEELDLRVPTDEGECFDFADVAPGLTVHSARLQWIVDVAYDGPDLTGKLQARAFAAKAGDEVFLSRNRLGPVLTTDLGGEPTRLAGAAVLDPSQLEALNDREVCWGVEVTGEDVAAPEDGTATIDYSIERLRLRITFSVF